MKPRIAVVGTGVAGLGCAWNLRDVADVTLIEREPRTGGHSNTVVVDEEGTPVPVDTGFIVFNHATYPHLTKLFSELGVRTKPAEMSFSVSHRPAGIEYNGMGLNKVFAQRRNLLRPRFHALLRQIMRFFEVAGPALADPATANLTLREFTQQWGLGKDFLDFYLVPMSSAVWSTEAGRVLDFPALSLLRFFQNHGFLGVRTHHPWFTVDGGSRVYVDKILAAFQPARLPARVVAVEETPHGALVRIESGETLTFDRVVIAAHADEALAMLAAPDDEQRRLLGAFGYQRNSATLHTDARVMPDRRRAWASWNYRIEADAGGRTTATTHYWMNALQNVSKRRNYFVSINMRNEPENVLYRTVYEHPVYTLEALRAQGGLPGLNRRRPDQRIFFCGSYFRYGFHEDAYASAVELAAVLRPLLAA